MSGVGKSTLVAELRRRGYTAYDADDDGFAEPRSDGRWGWRAEAVADLLAHAPEGLLFLAGCSEEQATLPFDYRVLLTAPRDELIRRLRRRTTNAYGQTDGELAQILADLDEVEPLLRRSADLVLDATDSPAALADDLLRRLGQSPRPGPSGTHINASRDGNGSSSPAKSPSVARPEGRSGWTTAAAWRAAAMPMGPSRAEAR